jgi:hypothetical protein
MRNLQSATRFLHERFIRRVLPAARLLRERLVARPLKVLSPFLKRGAAVRPALIALIVTGVVLAFVGVRQYRRSSPASAASASSPSPAADLATIRPYEITCADLAAKGPGTSDYVRLTDFEIGDHSVHRAPVGYVLAVPLAVKDSPAVRPHKVIVRTTQARSARDLYSLEKAPLLGTVVKGITSLASDEQALLRKRFSHMDLDTCWVIEAGNKPAPRTVARGGRAADDVAGSAGTAGRPGLGLIGLGAGVAVVAAGALLLAGRRA